MLRNVYLFIVFAMMSAVMSSCGSDTFKVEGRIDGDGRQNLRAVYFADGAVRMIPAMSVDGKFGFEGRASEPSMVELYTSDRNLLGRFVVKNGETVKCEFVRDDPYKLKIEGNDLSERWAQFLRDNATVLREGDAAKVNMLVAEMVEREPSSRLSSLLFATLYDAAADPAGAQALFDKLDQSLRSAPELDGYAERLAVVGDEAKLAPIKEMRLFSVGDTMKTYRLTGYKAVLIGFSAFDDRRGRIITKGLKKLANGAKNDDRLILDVSVDADTAKWREAIEKDSATWIQAWAPGAVAAATVAPLAIDRLPFFVVTDSAGNQLYRGAHLEEASAVMTKQLKK